MGNRNLYGLGSHGKICIGASSTCKIKRDVSNINKHISLAIGSRKNLFKSLLYIFYGAPLVLEQKKRFVWNATKKTKNYNSGVQVPELYISGVPVPELYFSFLVEILQIRSTGSWVVEIPRLVLFHLHSGSSSIGPKYAQVVLK